MRKEITPANRHDLSVLFVDDNEIIRKLYQRLLEKHVAHFYIANDGKQGLELYNTHKPDLVITDINMPVMDGIVMVREIKAKYPNAKIIVMSAYSVKENFIESINLGVDGYLMKPVEAKKLLSLIDEFAGITMMKWELERKEEKRKLAEESLKKSLAEKDVLLREVHHRVKNNMQIISSILRMQSRGIKDEKLKVVLQESQNRIHSMALIHENLYSNEGLEDVKFDNYIKSLVGNIARTYNSNQFRVKYNYNVESANLPMDIAIPCGLIINELVSNSLKYAFNGKSEGLITITFKNIGNNNYDLIVEDNGIGISSDFDIKKTKSLGMKIIHKLAQQIDGELISDFSNGTKFSIKLKINI
ncbi:MAG: response regulator [Bacteroidales bacterium]|nr:response regulator [Bacteroidales bacterium]